MTCWGDDLHGQLGSASVGAELAPRAGAPRVAQGITASALAAGLEHTCAIVAGGEVRCWGMARSRQLGDGHTALASPPVAVVGLPGPADEVGAGEAFTCARLASEVWCWGGNDRQQLGREGEGSATPVRVELSGLLDAR